MYIRIIKIIFICHLITVYGNEDSSSHNIQIKRGLYQVTENLNYDNVNPLPTHQTKPDISQIDLTYKSNENIKTEQPIPIPYYPLNYNQNAKPILGFNEPIFSTQNIYPNYASNDFGTTFNSPHFGSTYQGLQSGTPSLSAFASDKHLYQPTNLGSSQIIKLPEFDDGLTSTPIIYGQPIRYTQPLIKQSHPTTFNTVSLNGHEPTQIFNQFKSPIKIQSSIPLRTHYSSPIIHPATAHRPINSNILKPKTLENPVISHSVQYFPPKQNPFIFKSVTSAPIIVQSSPTPQKPNKTASENDNDKQENEEVEEDEEEEEQKEDNDEVHDEEEFEKGYKEAAKGFPAYDRYENEDDFERQKFKYGEDNDDEYDEENGHHSEYDHEAHYSEKHHKKEPNEKYKGITKSQYKDTPKNKKLNDKEYSKKSFKTYKYQKLPNDKKVYGDTKYAGSTNQKELVKKQNSKTKGRDYSKKDQFKPKYEYGFKPIKNPYKEDLEDSESEHSSPIFTKVYRAHWTIGTSKRS